MKSALVLIILEHLGLKFEVINKIKMCKSPLSFKTDFNSCCGHSFISSEKANLQMISDQSYQLMGSLGFIRDEHIFHLFASVVLISYYFIKNLCKFPKLIHLQFDVQMSQCEFKDTVVNLIEISFFHHKNITMHNMTVSVSLAPSFSLHGPVRTSQLLLLLSKWKDYPFSLSKFFSSKEILILIRIVSLCATNTQIFHLFS